MRKPQSTVQPYSEEKMSDLMTQLLNSPLVVINLGVDRFAKDLEDQKVEVVRVDWRPPAGGDQVMIDLLDQLL